MSNKEQRDQPDNREEESIAKLMPKKSLFQHLSSLKLAVVIFTYLVVICIIATLLPQNQVAAFYSQNYGALGKLIVALQMDQMFSSLWILIGGIALGINLLACTWRRLQWTRKNRGRGETAKFSLTGEAERFDGSLEEAEAAFRRSHPRFAFKRAVDEQGSVALTGVRGKFTLWGSPLLHLGLCVVLLGVLFSLLLGESTYETLAVGEEKEITVGPKPYTLCIDEFDIEYYEDGTTPKQYVSTMTAISGAEETALTSIVNGPASYHRTQILQSSYSWALQIEVDDGDQVQDVSVIDGELYWLNESQHLSLQVRFYPNYSLDDEGYITNSDAAANNPVLLCMVWHNDEPLAADSLALGEAKELLEGVELKFVGFQYATGLQIKYDPGIMIIFIGFIIIAAGMMLRFIVPGKILRAVLTSQEEGVKIIWQQTSII